MGEKQEKSFTRCEMNFHFFSRVELYKCLTRKLLKLKLSIFTIVNVQTAITIFFKALVFCSQVKYEIIHFYYLFHPVHPQHEIEKLQATCHAYKKTRKICFSHLALLSTNRLMLYFMNF